MFKPCSKKPSRQRKEPASVLKRHRGNLRAITKRHSLVKGFYFTDDNPRGHQSRQNHVQREENLSPDFSKLTHQSKVTEAQQTFLQVQPAVSWLKCKRASRGPLTIQLLVAWNGFIPPALMKCVFTGSGILSWQVVWVWVFVGVLSFKRHHSVVSDESWVVGSIPFKGMFPFFLAAFKNILYPFFEVIWRCICYRCIVLLDIYWAS